ncbi:MAG TPA: hypothetical protein VMT23_03445, partial [Candidatus Binatia bacterium]|nr:hypothetical protein [Candidatus Binatia bacterium]
NQSADPTGVSGAMYYNTSTNTFRCYQNGAWVNCISPWIGITKTTAQDVTNSATYANDSVLQFPVTGGVTYTVRFYIVYSGSNATGDYKGEFLFPAAIAAKNVSGTYVSTTTADAIQSSAGVLGATTTFPSGGLSLGTAATVADQRVFQGTFSFQPNSSGTMNYQFANNAAAAGRISETCAGSYIEYQVQ